MRHEETRSARALRNKQFEAEAATLEQGRERQRVERLHTRSQGHNTTGAVAEGVVHEELFYSRLGYAQHTPPRSDTVMAWRDLGGALR